MGEYRKLKDLPLDAYFTIGRNTTPYKLVRLEINGEIRYEHVATGRLLLTAENLNVKFLKADYVLRNNQYGYMPAKTYWYIKHTNGKFWHHDGKLRNYTLAGMEKYAFKDEASAQAQLDKINS